MVFSGLGGMCLYDLPRRKIFRHLRQDPKCKKGFKECKPFSSLKQRLQGTEITTVKKQYPSQSFCLFFPLQKQPGNKSIWTQHHEDFINAIQSVKQVTKALKEGHPLPPPPPTKLQSRFVGYFILLLLSY
ncbi:PREDICTED: zinc finger C2HC domain-containing protein 1B [Chaetura pelagica]|uniref:zinc finger C2HC domain-containing protein 1B n=1 Tax=Chaetura pelagica TaxID=8897 RepID=UPI00052341A1|nr:PREDICTED: zinc finger C2HC domain-containing protein 1B [Chaetura pelagica]